MCLACQMEADWLAYLEHLAQQELPQEPAPAADGVSPPKPAMKPEPAPASPFVCEEQPSE